MEKGRTKAKCKFPPARIDLIAPGSILTMSGSIHPPVAAVVESQYVAVIPLDYGV